MSFTEFIFNQPSLLIIIAIVFLTLGMAIMYFLMRQTDEYVRALRKENRELRAAKNKILHQLLEAENELKIYEQQSRGA